MNLDDIIAGAQATTDRIISSVLAPTQHVCAHATGGVIVWESGRHGKAFGKEIFRFDEASKKQFEVFRALSKESDRLWRDNLIARAKKAGRPSVKLNFSLNSRHNTWEAKVKKGRVTLYPLKSEELGMRFSVDMGADSSISFSGFLPGCDVEDTKKYVYLQCTDSLLYSYRANSSYAIQN